MRDFENHDAATVDNTDPVLAIRTSMRQLPVPAASAPVTPVGAAPVTPVDDRAPHWNEEVHTELREITVTRSGLYDPTVTQTSTRTETVRVTRKRLRPFGCNGCGACTCKRPTTDSV